MRRADETPYDTPACERCGAEVETRGALCADCLGEAELRLEKRRRWLLEVGGAQRAHSRGNEK